MPRQKKFCVENVVEKAMVAFWDRGYHGTSLQDLVECMGVNRASLYDTFDDKYSLFLDSLHAYKFIYIKSYLADQAKKHTPRQAIVNYFLDMILKAEERNGCLIVNTALEISPHDDTVAQIVHEAFAYIEKNFFRKMIKKGQACGEISKTVVSTTTAQSLLSLLIGLCVLSRSNTSNPVMMAVVSQVKALLPPNNKTKGFPHPSHTLKNNGRKTQSSVAHVV